MSIMSTYKVYTDIEVLQYIEPWLGDYSKSTNYIGRDIVDVFYYDETRNQKLRIDEIIILINSTKKKKFRSESVKVEFTKHLSNVLSLLRHYRIDLMLEPRPLMSHLDQLSLAC